MKKLVLLLSIFFYIFSSAQVPPPPSKSSYKTSNNGLTINSRRGTLIQKEITTLGKFKTLNFQKISSKDLSDGTVENVLGVMLQSETYDQIWKRTLTIDKAELTKLIAALQTVEQKEQERTAVETKYKFVTNNNIEFGGVYNNDSRLWNNYINFPSNSFNQNFIEYSKDELKDFLKILKAVEKEL